MSVYVVVVSSWRKNVWATIRSSTGGLKYRVQRTGDARGGRSSFSFPSFSSCRVSGVFSGKGSLLQCSAPCSGFLGMSLRAFPLGIYLSFSSGEAKCPPPAKHSDCKALRVPRVVDPFRLRCAVHALAFSQDVQGRVLSDCLVAQDQQRVTDPFLRPE